MKNNQQTDFFADLFADRVRSIAREVAREEIRAELAALFCGGVGSARKCRHTPGPKKRSRLLPPAPAPFKFAALIVKSGVVPPDWRGSASQLRLLLLGDGSALTPEERLLVPASNWIGRLLGELPNLYVYSRRTSGGVGGSREWAVRSLGGPTS